MRLTRSGVKPITAYVGGLGASAAYWLGSAADVVVADATAELGSIGVVATYVDTRDAQRAAGIDEIEIVSSATPKKRTDPRTDEGRAQIQTLVDDLAAVFIADVARNRGVSEATVRNDFGQGGLLVGQAAVTAGLADRLGSLEGVIAESQTRETIVTEELTMTGQASQNPQASDAPGADGQPVTAAELAQAYPEAAEALRAEGATAERERIQAVEAQALPGHEALIEQLRLDGQTTGEQAAIQVLKAERERSAGVRQATLAEGADLDQVPGTHSATGEVETSRSAGPAPDAPLAERIQAEWEADPALAQEFSSFEAYKAYREAEERGQVAKIG